MKESRRLELQAQLAHAASTRCVGTPVFGASGLTFSVETRPAIWYHIRGAQHISQEGPKDGNE